MNYFPYVDQDPGAWRPPGSAPESPGGDELRAARGIVLSLALGAGAWALAVVAVRLLNLAVDTAWAAAQVCP
jgi:hypothetical protein